MQQMSEREWRAFAMEGSRTGKLATVGDDTQPHVVPIWFVLNEGDLVFTTGADTVKVRNMRRNPRVAIAVDDETFPFAFVMIRGEATLETPDAAALLPYTTRLAWRYVGAERAAPFGRRNAVDGELLVRVKIADVVAHKEIAD